jgi:hypothetical protein
MRKEIDPMKNTIIPIGSRVCVTSYGPFKGLEGTIRQVDTIVDDLEELICFYSVALEGAALEEPIWFEYSEVEPIGFPVVVRPPRTELTLAEPRQD